MPEHRLSLGHASTRPRPDERYRSTVSRYEEEGKANDRDHFVDSLTSQQFRFVRRWLEEADQDRARKREALRRSLNQRDPVRGPQAALAFIVANDCPQRAHSLPVGYIGSSPSDAVLDHLVRVYAAYQEDPRGALERLATVCSPSADRGQASRHKGDFSAALVRQALRLPARLHEAAGRVKELTGSPMAGH